MTFRKGIIFNRRLPFLDKVCCGHEQEPLDARGLRSLDKGKRSKGFMSRGTRAAAWIKNSRPESAVAIRSGGHSACQGRASSRPSNSTSRPRAKRERATARPRNPDAPVNPTRARAPLMAASQH
jgi:hypothetical protein